MSPGATAVLAALGAFVLCLIAVFWVTVVLIYLAAGVMHLVRRWQGEPRRGERPLQGCGFHHSGPCGGHCER